MGFNGDIGTIEIDFDGDTFASDGHKVLSFNKGKVNLESSRYPFCFSEAETSSEFFLSTLQLVPFNNELNRLILIVNNLPTDKAMITWGATEKEFSREQLQTGINLADEFSNNPFSKYFIEINKAVLDKQIFETSMIKECNLGKITELLGPDETLDHIIEDLRAKFMTKHQILEEDVRKSVVPVRHSIEVKVR